VTTTAPVRTDTVLRRLKTPVGELLLAGDGQTLSAIYLPGFAPEGLGAPSSAASAAVEEAADQLAEYFDGRRRSFTLRLRPSGTPFQESVWWALADIDYGTTISYAELASRVGRPRAFRAVGQANGANPLPIVLPCHRVVASGGGIGGYGGGLDMKRALLALETGHG
jgi:methylated-DNA-[protein]-cysteine S-methyltransferase